MKKLLGLALLLLASNVVWAQSAVEAANFKYRERFIASTALYQKLSTSDVKLSYVYQYQIGDNYLLLGKKDSARYYFTLLTASSDHHHQAYGALGMGKLVFDSNPTEGKNLFMKALESSKHSDAFVLAEVAAAYVAAEGNRNLNEAKLLIEKALKIDGANTRYMIVYGDVLRAIAATDATNGDVSLATAQYNKASFADPKYALPYIRLGRLYVGSKAYSEGEKKFNEGFAKDSTYGPYHKEYSDLYYAKGKYQQSLQSYEKYMKMVDTTTTILYRYSLLLVQVSKYKEALPYLQRLERAGYDNPVLYRLLTYCQYETGNIQASQASMNKFMAMPNHPALLARDYEYQGKLAYKSSQDSIGTELILKAYAMDSTRIDLLNAIGDNYYGKKDYVQATKYYKLKLQKSKSGNALDYFNLGKASYFANDLVTADTAFASLIALKPDVPQGYLWRARVQEKNDPDQSKGLAKPYYEKYIEVASKEAAKNKVDLITAYDYLASYYYFQKKDKTTAKLYWAKILELDPANAKAKQGMKL